MSVKSCDDYQELASAFADDLLETAEISDLQGHLRDCLECRQFLSGIHRVSDFIRAEEVRHSLPAPSARFTSDIALALGRGAGQAPAASNLVTGRFFSAWVRFSGAAAAAVLLLAAGWSLRQFSDSEVAPTVSEKVVVEREEASMATYVRQHAFQSMDATYLGFPDGVELARFEGAGTGFE